MQIVFDTIIQALGALGGIFLKLLRLFLWGFAGIFILLAVFIANTFYPKWEKYAETLKE